MNIQKMYLRRKTDVYIEICLLSKMFFIPGKHVLKTSAGDPYDTSKTFDNVASLD